MPQNTHGIRSFLSIPSIYRLFGFLIGGAACRATFVREYVQPKVGDRILDIGCGPADIVAYLPDVEYVGFDASRDYIESAQARFGEHATFICEPISSATPKERSYFDIVLAMGVLHHLDDSEALQFFSLAMAALKPGGRLITFDGVIVESQYPWTRWIISKDRGQYVRTKEGYLQLASEVFSDIRISIRHDLLRIPYTHIILECTKSTGD